MSTNRNVAVFGAYGHTAQFVIAQLCERGWTPMFVGRDADRLAALGAMFPQRASQLARVEDAASLDRALAGAVAVVNCAGPFLDTATPLVEAALRAGIHYLDLSAEQASVLDVFERFDAAARAAQVTVLPAMAFYGGLADLLATAALGDWPDADRIDIAVALDRWHPTAGTRRTGARNHGARQVVTNGRLAPLDAPPPTRDWTFPPPFGVQQMVALPLTEIITISRHLRCPEVHSHMNLQPLADLRDPHTPPPHAADARGRSAQMFAVQARVQRGDRTRRATAHGRDIYAITAPLVVEALERICAAPGTAPGVLAAGAAFDARAFLDAMADLHIAFADA